MKQRIDYFLGIGQAGWSARWLTRRLPTINFHEGPDYHKYKNDKDLERCGLEAVAKAMGTHKGGIILAESQAASAVIAAIYSKTIALPKQLVLIQPLGLTFPVLGNKPIERREELFLRSRKFWFHPSQSLLVPGNLHTFANLIYQIVRYGSNTRQGFLFGANQDYRTELEWIASKIPVDLYASEDDSLFPFHEIKKHAPTTARLHKISGTHLNRATPNGLRQLKKIISAVQ